MILQLFKKTKNLKLERTYAKKRETVWRAWTEPELVRRWWGPTNTVVPTCEIDLRQGGAIHIVMEATEGMGKYAGTRWPMMGSFTTIEPVERLAYDARSWTEGEEEATTLVHTNTIGLVAVPEGTHVTLDVVIQQIGPKAKLAAFGMKWGYKQYLAKLDAVLASLS